jgi:hypothetical protein
MESTLIVHGRATDSSVHARLDRGLGHGPIEDAGSKTKPWSTAR